jgi:hypothetical protein
MDRVDLHGLIDFQRLQQRCAGLPVPTVPGAFVKRGARDEPRGTHDVEHARGKAEQEKNDEPPGRDAEPAIDEPANAGPDHDACNEFAGEPKALGVA